MAAALRHRGPDEFGIYRDAHCGLAHARLSIIDLVTGQQPLTNEDDSLWISFNGEIFNYLELREELFALGHFFRTRSDTEVIVHSFEQWGEECFARFNGQFAIALWDAKGQRLTLARDRLGVRPLHICRRGSQFVFRLRGQGIFASDPDLPRALDPAGLQRPSASGRRYPAHGLPRRRRAAAGHARTYTRAGEMRERSSGDLRYPHVHETAMASVRARRRKPPRRSARRCWRAVERACCEPDVPVGSYLSGGLDSSLVAALGPPGKASASAHSVCVRRRRIRRDALPAPDGSAPRNGSRRRLVTPPRHRSRFPEVIFHTERPILARHPRRWRCYPAGARERHQGGTHGRGSGRDVRGL